MKYVIRDREAGNFIDSFDTLEQAQKALEEYEAQDKADEIYEENFYEIVEQYEVVADRNGDIDIDYYDDMEDAIRAAQDRYNGWTESEKKKYSVVAYGINSSYNPAVKSFRVSYLVEGDPERKYIDAPIIAKNWQDAIEGYAFGLEDFGEDYDVFVNSFSTEVYHNGERWYSFMADEILPEC